MRLKPLTGIVFETRAAYQRALFETLGPDWVTAIVEEVEWRGHQLSSRAAGEIIGYEANGWLGQYVVVIPAAELVAVRLIREKPSYDSERDGFTDFIDRVRALA